MVADMTPSKETEVQALPFSFSFYYYSQLDSCRGMIFPFFDAILFSACEPMPVVAPTLPFFC